MGPVLSGYLLINIFKEVFSYWNLTKIANLFVQSNRAHKPGDGFIQFTV